MVFVFGVGHLVGANIPLAALGFFLVATGMFLAAEGTHLGSRGCLIIR